MHEEENCSSNYGSCDSFFYAFECFGSMEKRCVRKLEVVRRKYDSNRVEMDLGKVLFL